MKYENVVFPDGIGFKCKHCGFCCRYIPGDVNAEEQRKIEAKGFTDFSETPDITGLRLIRRKNNGKSMEPADYVKRSCPSSKESHNYRHSSLFKGPKIERAQKKLFVHTKLFFNALLFNFPRYNVNSSRFGEYSLDNFELVGNNLIYL